MEAAAVANEFIEAFNEADWKRFTATCSPDVVYEEKGSNRTVKGIDDVLEAAKGWRAAFPDVRGSVEFDGVQVFIVEGGKVKHMRHYLDLLTMLSQVGAMPG